MDRDSRHIAGFAMTGIEWSIWRWLTLLDDSEAGGFGRMQA